MNGMLKDSKNGMIKPAYPIRADGLLEKVAGVGANPPVAPQPSAALLTAPPGPCGTYAVLHNRMFKLRTVPMGKPITFQCSLKHKHMQSAHT